MFQHYKSGQYYTLKFEINVKRSERNKDSVFVNKLLNQWLDKKNTLIKECHKTNCGRSERQILLQLKFCKKKIEQQLSQTISKYLLSLDIIVNITTIYIYI